MTKEEWKKLKKHLGFGPYDQQLGRRVRQSACPICTQVITEDSDGAGVTYSKTKAGTHLFIHEKCLK